MENDVVIVSARRSPFGKYLGSLSYLDPVDLAATAGLDTLKKRGMNLAGHVDQVFVGNCIPAAFESASVVGRQIALKMGLSCFTTTIDTACCSSLTALRLASTLIRCGEIQTALVIGVDVMSRTPHYARGLRKGIRIGNLNMVDPIFPIEYAGYNSVGMDAANGAAKYGISKRQMDIWALRSHQKWMEAFNKNKFEDEIVPVSAKVEKNLVLVDRDESPRENVKLAEIENLPTIFGTQTITAGNAPGLNDGACAMVVMSAKKAKETGIEPSGTILAQECTTAEPAGISWVPSLAIKKALGRTGMILDNLDLIEINEAFAAVTLVSTKILAGEKDGVWDSVLQKTNVNGGAVAIGHPVGASGLRILMTLMYELRRRGGGTGAAGICGGLAQGEAVIIRT